MSGDGRVGDELVDDEPAAGEVAARGGAGTDESQDRDGGPTIDRRLVRGIAWIIAFGLWSVLCFVWLFPLLTELGLDPTLGG